MASGSVLSLFLFFVLLLWTTEAATIKEQQTEVVYAFVVARHGERAPVTRLANDPNNNFWDATPGRLTKRGMKQVYDLGRFLRKRYNNLVSNLTGDQEVFARSTDKDRTLVSAQLVLAGFYGPPQPQEKWSDDLGKAWQPVAVHSKSADQDPFIDSYYHHCPRHDQYMNVIAETPEGQRKYNRTLEILAATKEHSNFTWKDFHDFLDFGDVVHIERKLKLPLPAYLEPYGQEVDDLFSYFSFYYIKTEEERKLAGGYQVHEILDRIKKAKDGKLAPVKLDYYSAHDYAIMFTMAAWDMFNDIVSPFATALIVELHKDKQQEQQHYIQVQLRNDSSVEPYQLYFPSCPGQALCPFETIWQLSEPFFIKDLEEMARACKPYTEPELADLRKKLSAQFP